MGSYIKPKYMSVSPLYLATNDFYILNPENPGGQVKLCTRLRGLSFVYFYSNDCAYCDIFKPIFEELPKEIGGCHFAMINVSDCKQIVKASTNTTTPIKYVPYLILYINNTPFMRYDGERELTSIKKFIFDVAESLQSNNTQCSLSNKEGCDPASRTLEDMKKDLRSDGDSKQVPSYTGIYRPKNDRENVCFLTLDQAYGPVN